MEEFTLNEHLVELRKRLIIVSVVFILSLIIGFVFASDIFNILKSHKVAESVDWNVFNYTDGIMIYVQCALIVALGLTIPIFMHQAWLFAKPGLSKKEERGILFLIPTALMLFIIGIAFAYLVLFPLMIQFMGNINSTIGATETYGMKQYFSFMFSLLLPVALIFELPVVISFLTRIGIVNSQLLRKSRKISYMLLIIIGVSITPPDFISDFLIIFPMIVLFEVSIIIAQRIEKHQLTK